MKFLFPAILTCAGLLLTATAGQAAPRGGGGHSGGGGGYNRGGGGYYRGGIGIGVGVYPYYGYGYGPVYDPYYYGPRVSYYPAYPAPILGQFAPNEPAAPAAPAASAGPANIRVLVPDAQAKVLFDGSLTNQKGTDRLFHTPTLAPGGTYSYRIRASWIQNGKEMVQESVVPVTPGQTSTVDFTRPLSEPLPAPKE